MDPLHDSPAPHPTANKIKYPSPIGPDRRFARRIAVGIAVSLVVNAFLFGYGGIMGHRFLQSLDIMREKDSEVPVRWIVLPPSPRPKNHASPTPRPGARKLSTPGPLSRKRGWANRKSDGFA